MIQEPESPARTKKSAEPPRRKPGEDPSAYFDLFDQAPVGYLVLDADGRILEANRTLSALLGYPSSALLQHPLARFVHPADQDLFARFRQALSEPPAPQTCELRMEHKDGTLLWVHLTAALVPAASGSPACRVVLCDVTAHKQTEQFLRRLHVLLAQVNQAIVHFRNRDELFLEICRLAVQHGEFACAWIGLADAATRLLRPVAHAGRDDGFLKSIHVNVNPDSAFSQGPIGQAFLRNQVVACNDADPEFRRSPWCAEMLKRGLRSLAAVPFRLGGAVLGTLNLYVDDSCTFSAAERDLLQRIGGTLSFALDGFEIDKSRLRAEAALRESEAQNRAFIRAIPDLIFRNDRAGKYLAVHAPDPALLAAPVDAILDRTIHDLLPQPIADRCLAAIAAALDSRALQKVTYALPLDGAKRRFEARIVPCTPDTVLTIVRDVSELVSKKPPRRRK